MKSPGRDSGKEKDKRKVQKDTWLELNREISWKKENRRMK